MRMILIFGVILVLLVACKKTEKTPISSLSQDVTSNEYCKVVTDSMLSKLSKKHLTVREFVIASQLVKKISEATIFMPKFGRTGPMIFSDDLDFKPKRAEVNIQLPSVNNSKQELLIIQILIDSGGVKFDSTFLPNLNKALKTPDNSNGFADKMIVWQSKIIK